VRRWRLLTCYFAQGAIGNNRELPPLFAGLRKTHCGVAPHACGAFRARSTPVIHMFDEWFANKLVQCGHTERSVAVALGISQQAVSRWRVGESRPRDHRLAQLADLLEVPLDEVLANLESRPIALDRQDVALRALSGHLDELRTRVAHLEAKENEATDPE
jgi:transcriptional regulator with XRE-family HTH domain